MDNPAQNHTHDYDLWKYYGAIGGADKDRMIQIVSWLLAFSSGILGAYASNQLGFAQSKGDALNAKPELLESFGYSCLSLLFR